MFFLKEVAAKRMDEGVVQEWNSWMWAAETDRIEELIFPMVLRSLQRRGLAALPVLDGVSSCLGSRMIALTDVSWEQRVLHACWRVSFRPPRHLHQRLSLPQRQQSDSCSRRGNSGAKLRRVSWIADSTYALDVTTQRCRVNANTAMANLARGAWSAVRRLSRVETFHVRSHTGEPRTCFGASRHERELVRGG